MPTLNLWCPIQGPFTAAPAQLNNFLRLYDPLTGISKEKIQAIA
jgi:hypothetical protein